MTSNKLSRREWLKTSASVALATTGATNLVFGQTEPNRLDTMLTIDGVHYGHHPDLYLVGTVRTATT